MKNEQASARTADAVQFMQLRVAAKDVVQLVEYMLQHGEWYLAEERIERLRNALEGSVCPACGSDRNERDELDKAEREIERLRSAQRTHHDSHKTAWRPVFLHPPAAEVQRLREALEYLIEKCGDSDDAQYSTLGTKFVRDIARRALEGS